MVCTLIDNDTRHHSGQSVVDSRGADNERNLCQDFTDADLKVPALHCAKEFLVRDRLSFLSKTFANSLNMQKKYCQFSHDVTKIQTTKLLILLIFYFNKV